jgi:hypothetical protein
MTEAEWFGCTDPQAMLEFLRGKANDRKLRLFACACSRLVSHLLIDERSFAAVEAAEGFSDGLVGDSERQVAFSSACTASRDVGQSPGAWPDTVLRLRRQHDPHKLSRAAVMAAFAAGRGASDVDALIRCAKQKFVDEVTQSRVLSDIFGNPFHPVALDPAWRTPKVTALAEGVYEQRSFDRMPELAAALEEAGCTDQDTISHCRGPGPHVRGCWVVDLLLGKE